MSGWSEWQIETFRRMRKEGALYRDISAAIGKSRNAIAGRASREDGRKCTKNRVRKIKSKRVLAPKFDTGSWDAKLFEPWELRKARRALERQNVST